jgi:hypothetical protein
MVYLSIEVLYSEISNAGEMCLNMHDKDRFYIDLKQ